MAIAMVKILGGGGGGGGGGGIRMVLSVMEISNLVWGNRSPCQPLTVAVVVCMTDDGG